jgi:2-polyprenyl-6-hydroxyphenyl methylase/3-demethylubiquinone-9 3-methyltransferase
MSTLQTPYIADYEVFNGQWWDPRGPLAGLSWMARSRAELIPPATRAGAVLLDVACGGGLMSPHVLGKGYRHIGVDLAAGALAEARQHGLAAVLRGDMGRLPIADGTVDVVSAGHCLEHVPDPALVVRECCRVLRPGGTFVTDTIADTFLAKLIVITICERLPLPGMPPRGTHDARLLVNRELLVATARAHGVELRMCGLFPRIGHSLRWLAGRHDHVPLVRIRATGVFFQAVGEKCRNRS